MTEQTIKVKCPHCGWVRKMRIDVQNGEVLVALGPVEKMQKAGQDLLALAKNIFERLQHGQPAEDVWIDITKPCPKCERTYQYNVRTGETRP